MADGEPAKVVALKERLNQLAKLVLVLYFFHCMWTISNVLHYKLISSAFLHKFFEMYIPLN